MECVGSPVFFVNLHIMKLFIHFALIHAFEVNSTIIRLLINKERVLNSKLSIHFDILHVIAPTQSL